MTDVFVTIDGYAWFRVGGVITVSVRYRPRPEKGEIHFSYDENDGGQHILMSQKHATLVLTGEPPLLVEIHPVAQLTGWQDRLDMSVSFRVATGGQSE